MKTLKDILEKLSGRTDREGSGSKQPSSNARDRVYRNTIAANQAIKKRRRDYTAAAKKKYGSDLGTPEAQARIKADNDAYAKAFGGTPVTGKEKAPGWKPVVK